MSVFSTEVVKWVTATALLAQCPEVSHSQGRGLAAKAAGIATSSKPLIPQPSNCLSPTALAATPDQKTLFIAYATAKQIAAFDCVHEKITRIVPMPAAPLGLALSEDGRLLYVTCAAPESMIAVVGIAAGRVISTMPAGHTAMAPVLSRDGKTLYVCNRFNNEVALIELATGKTVSRIAVPREPVAAALTPDGRLLFAANHIHAGRADAESVSSSVSVIAPAAGKVIKDIALPDGSGLLRGLAISPDGQYACVTHVLSRFHLPTTQIERGWINSAALSIIGVPSLRTINTVLLDNIDSGAANPWAVEWTRDGKRIVITHAGTHELSVIDAPALLAKLAAMPAAFEPGVRSDYAAASRVAADVRNDLSFLVGLRTRIKLPENDRGPRGLALAGDTAFVANYFSDTLSVIDLAPGKACGVKSFNLGPKSEPGAVRTGEFYFNDASICFQGWQSCSSCHSADARVDGLNWDNLNDGIGNPKNAKSLLNAHRTPPSMWLGVRSNPSVAVRAGIRNSLFTAQPPEVAEAIDEYLESLKPIPSPNLVKGKLSKAAERGRKLFFDETVGCADCHKPPLYTDLKLHDVGTRGRFDRPADKFDTPSLVEAWRSAPYLHDGRAATVREVTVMCNQGDQHGRTSQLGKEQIDDLVAFVLSQ